MRPSRAGRTGNSALPPSRSPTALWPAALILAVGIATYANSVGAPFIWDDQTAIVNNRTIQQLWPVWAPLSPPRDTPVAGRPLVNWSLAVNYAIGGLDETTYHAVNIALHIACALLLFGIVRRTLSNRALALAIALLWMVHPLVSEVVDYVTQRSESLMALFLLLTLYAAIRARPRAEPVSKRSKRVVSNGRWEMVAVVACMCGMAAKESMLVAPLIVVLYDRAFLFDSFRNALQGRARLYAGLAMSWAIAGVILWSAPRSTVGSSSAVSSWMYLLNQVGVLWRYLRLSIWPSQLVLDYGLPRTVSLADVWPGGLLLAALVVGAVVLWVRWPRVGFLAVSFFMLLAPTSSVIPIRTELGAERRMYLPLAALVTLAVVALHALAERRRMEGRGSVPAWAATGATAVLVTALAATTIARNAEYRDFITLWRADVERRPHGRSRMAYATELATAGRHADAIEQLRLAVADFPDARSALGTELIVQEHYDEGAAILKTFIADGPSKPNRIPAHVILAQTYSVQGRLTEAEAEWRALLVLSPGDPAARVGLARTLAVQAQAALQKGDLPRGETFAREAVQLSPRDAVAINMLGVALASRGQFEQARTHFRNALEIAPDDRQVRNNLERAERAVAATKGRSNP